MIELFSFFLLKNDSSAYFPYDFFQYEKNFPHDNFADWQFYQLMTGSRSLVRDAEMPDSSALQYLAVFE